MDEEMRFATLIFHRTLNPSFKGPRNGDFLKDILISKLSSLEHMVDEEMQSQTNKFVELIRPFLGDTQALGAFRILVENATESLPKRVAKSLRKEEIGKRFLNIIKMACYLAIISISGLHLYWDKIAWMFHGIPYDSKIFVAQVSLITGLLMILLKKQN